MRETVKLEFGIFLIRIQGSKSEPVTSIKNYGSGLHDELNSFYSDIASLEATFSQNKEEPIPATTANERISSETSEVATKCEEKTTKKKKKVSVSSI